MMDIAGRKAAGDYPGSPGTPPPDETVHRQVRVVRRTPGGRFFPLALGLVAVVSFGVLSGCGEKIKPGERELSRIQVPSAPTVVVTAVPVPDSRTLSGTVRIRETIRLAPRVMAVIDEILVREGDEVRRGQVLARLADTELAARREQAAAGLAAAEAAFRTAGAALAEAESGNELAQATLVRYEQLYADQAVTDQEMDTVRARARAAAAAVDRMKAGVEAAEAAVGQARAALREAEIWESFAVITAPEGGTVLRRNADPGSMAAPGQPLFEIARTGDYYLELPVEEGFIGKVSAGDSLPVAIPSAGLSGTVPVREVVPKVEPGSRTFIVKVALPDAWTPKLRDGLFGTAEVTVKTTEQVTVPAEALVVRGKLTGVFTVGADQVVRWRLVRTGRAGSRGVQVLAGLHPGERVVVGRINEMRDGALMGRGTSGTGPNESRKGL